MCAGLTGFSIALIAGLSAENPATDVLVRALLALIGCQFVGGIAGTIAERVMREAIVEYRATHPVNGSSTTASASPNQVQPTTAAA